MAKPRGSILKKGMTSRIPPIHSYTMDLTVLTEEEEKELKAVLEKDDAFNAGVDGRLSVIRHEIHEIKVKGALYPWDKKPHKICARCKYKFWSWLCPFGDHGTRCINCRFKVCKKCRFEQPNKTWICILCIKQRQERNLTGTWFNKGVCGGLIGSDLLKASMRDREFYKGVHHKKLKREIMDNAMLSMRRSTYDGRVKEHERRRKASEKKAEDREKRKSRKGSVKDEIDSEGGEGEDKSERRKSKDKDGRRHTKHGKDRKGSKDSNKGGKDSRKGSKDGRRGSKDSKSSRRGSKDRKGSRKGSKDSRRGSKDRKKSRKGSKEGRKGSKDRKQSRKGSKDGRKSSKDGRKSSKDGRKSIKDGRKSIKDGRKSIKDGKNGRKGSKDKNKNRNNGFGRLLSGSYSHSHVDRWSRLRSKWKVKEQNLESSKYNRKNMNEMRQIRNTKCSYFSLPNLPLTREQFELSYYCENVEFLENDFSGSAENSKANDSLKENRCLKNLRGCRSPDHLSDSEKAGMSHWIDTSESLFSQMAMTAEDSKLSRPTEMKHSVRNPSPPSEDDMTKTESTCYSNASPSRSFFCLPTLKTIKYKDSDCESWRPKTGNLPWRQAVENGGSSPEIILQSKNSTLEEHGQCCSGPTDQRDQRDPCRSSGLTNLFKKTSPVKKSTAATDLTRKENDYKDVKLLSSEIYGECFEVLSGVHKSSKRTQHQRRSRYTKNPALPNDGSRGVVGTTGESYVKKLDVRMDSRLKTPRPPKNRRNSVENAKAITTHDETDTTLNSQPTKDAHGVSGESYLSCDTEGQCDVNTNYAPRTERKRGSSSGLFTVDERDTNLNYQQTNPKSP